MREGGEGRNGSFKTCLKAASPSLAVSSTRIFCNVEPSEESSRLASCEQTAEVERGKGNPEINPKV